MKPTIGACGADTFSLQSIYNYSAFYWSQPMDQGADGLHVLTLIINELEYVSYKEPLSCQNPNLTTTQPQPNLNLVGFDTIITLPPPTPPHPTTQTLLLPEIMILGVWNFVGDLTKQN